MSIHPADELAAFEKMVGQGKSVEHVAAAFDVSPLTVKRRLKLAAVSPKLMALYRGGDIPLDCLMALASVDDHARQEMAWETVSAWNRRPESIRAVLAQHEVESDTDSVARFVGLKAYEQAGGSLRRDLFSQLPLECVQGAHRGGGDGGGRRGRGGSPRRAQEGRCGERR